MHGSASRSRRCSSPSSSARNEALAALSRGYGDPRFCCSCLRTSARSSWRRCGGPRCLRNSVKRTPIFRRGLTRSATSKAGDQFLPRISVRASTLNLSPHPGVLDHVRRRSPHRRRRLSYQPDASKLRGDVPARQSMISTSVPGTHNDALKHSAWKSSALVSFRSSQSLTSLLFPSPVSPGKWTMRMLAALAPPAGGPRSTSLGRSNAAGH